MCLSTAVTCFTRFVTRISNRMNRFYFMHFVPQLFPRFDLTGENKCIFEKKLFNRLVIVYQLEAGQISYISLLRMDSTKANFPKKVGRRNNCTATQQIRKRRIINENVIVKNFVPVQSKVEYLFEYCRVCAMASKSLIAIYEEPGIEMQLEEKINKYLPITVSKNDILPLKVCSNCIEKIEITHELILSSLDSDSKFKYVQSHSFHEEDETLLVNSEEPII